MKKSLLLMALTALLFVACKKDDGGGNDCNSCSLQGTKIQICDNGDGTYTLSGGGESDTINEDDLGGLTPKKYIETICALGSLGQ